MIVWLILALAVLPFLHSNFKLAPVETMHVFGIIVLGVSIAGAKVFQKNKFLGIGVFCVLASYLVARSTIFLTKDAFNILMFFLIWLMFYFAALKARPRPLLIAIAIAGTINAAYLGCQALGYDFVFSHLNMTPKVPIYGFLNSSGNSGVFQAICLPIALYIHPILGICTFIGLLLAHSVVSITAGVIGVSFYLLVRYSKLRKFALLIPVILAAILVLVDKPTMTDVRYRWAPVYHTLKFINRGKMVAYKFRRGKELEVRGYNLNYTLFGYGLGSFRASVPYVSGKNFSGIVNTADVKLRHPHNELVFVLYECGPIAMVMMICIAIGAMLKKTNPAIRGGILATSICGLGYFPLLIPAVTIYIAVFLGLNDGGKND